MDLIRKVRHGIPKIVADETERRARLTIQRNVPLLWDLISEYLKKSQSTGCSYSDYLTLYRHVRATRPKEVLECGTGVSTVVIAYALQENGEGRMVSMEEDNKYYAHAVTIFPSEFRALVDIEFSPAIEDTYHFFRGVRYKDVPKRAYDFVYVDGPNLLTEPKNAVLAFDMDLIRIVEQTKVPVRALVDTRTSTCYVYSIVFADTFYYDYVRKIGVLGASTKDSLLSARDIVARAMKKHSFARPPLGEWIRGSLAP